MPVVLFYHSFETGLIPESGPQFLVRLAARKPWQSFCLSNSSIARVARAYKTTLDLLLGCWGLNSCPMLLKQQTTKLNIKPPLQFLVFLLQTSLILFQLAAPAGRGFQHWSSAFYHWKVTNLLRSLLRRALIGPVLRAPSVQTINVQNCPDCTISLQIPVSVNRTF